MKKHNILALVISIPVAFLLWLYVVTLVSPNATITVSDIPVTFRGGEMLRDKDDRVLYWEVDPNQKLTLDVTLNGNRRTLEELNNQNITCAVDLSSITSAGTYTYDLEVRYPSDVAGTGNIELENQSLDTISVSVGALTVKTIPVALNYGGVTVPAPFFYDSENLEVTYPGKRAEEPKSQCSIRLYGRDVNLEKIEFAVADCSYLSELTDTDTRECPVTLCDVEKNPLFTQDDYYREAGGESSGFIRVLPSSAGEPAWSEATETSIEMDTAEVSVTLPIMKEKQISLDALLSETETVRTEYVEKTLSEESVTVRGAVSAIDAMPNSLIVGTLVLDPENLVDNKITAVFPLELPEGITLLNGSDKITVTAALDDMITKTFQILPENIIHADGDPVPETVILSQTGVRDPVEIELSGRATFLEQIDPASIRAEYRFADVYLGILESGTRVGEVAYTVYINDEPVQDMQGIEIIKQPRASICVAFKQPEPPKPASDSAEKTHQ